jgi:hypothetical protein
MHTLLRPTEAPLAATFTAHAHSRSCSARSRGHRHMQPTCAEQQVATGRSPVSQAGPAHTYTDTTRPGKHLHTNLPKLCPVSTNVQPLQSGSSLLLINRPSSAPAAPPFAASAAAVPPAPASPAALPSAAAAAAADAQHAAMSLSAVSALLPGI